MRFPEGYPASRRMVLPPARHWPVAICAATSSKSAALGCESASMKMSQSPVAALAPRLRARPIWLMGSKMTLAPAARATSAVRSVELLSQTMSSAASRVAQRRSWHRGRGEGIRRGGVLR